MSEPSNSLNFLSLTSVLFFVVICITVLVIFWRRRCLVASLRGATKNRSKLMKEIRETDPVNSDVEMDDIEDILPLKSENQISDILQLAPSDDIDVLVCVDEISDVKQSEHFPALLNVRSKPLLTHSSIVQLYRALPRSLAIKDLVLLFNLQRDGSNMSDFYSKVAAHTEGQS